MSRLVSYFFIFLLLVPLVSAVYSINAPGVLYEVRYSVISNGTVALIPLSIYQYDFLYSPNDSLAKFGKWHYLLYYNGSRLYLLNFTYLLARSPGVAFVNGSWYLDVTTYTYSGTDSAVYRLNLKNFSVVPVKTSWFKLLGENHAVSELNGWRIVVPKDFGPLNSSVPAADVAIANTEENARLYHGRVVLANSSEFPVYFLLRRGNETRNVTLLYVNTTPTSWTEYGSRLVTGLAGFWFPDNVRVVNVGPVADASSVPPWDVKVLNARYSIVSSGRDAIIHLFVATFVPYCPPLLVAGGFNCSNQTMLTLLEGYEYLFYYNGSRLYILNLTGAIHTPEVSLRDYNGAVFTNGSWYLNVTVFNWSTREYEDKIYLFDPREFCIEPVNVSWSGLMKKAKNADSISGWRIVIHYERESEKWGPADVYGVCASPFEEAKRLDYPCASLIIKKSGVIPVQITLKKVAYAKNITLAYLEMNSTSAYYRLSKNAVPVNVTLCEMKGASKMPVGTVIKTPSCGEENKNGTEKKTLKICGPGVMIVIAVGTLLFIGKRES